MAVKEGLPSWNDGPAKESIRSFVTEVTSERSKGFVPPEERIATFDNDGTLWCEKPMPIEFGFVLERLAAMAERDATLRGRQPWQAAYSKDYAWLSDAVTKHYQGDDTDLKVLLAGWFEAFRGMRVAAYRTAAQTFLRDGQNPHFKRRYLATAYKPMLELLRYLESHGFTTYIASGGDRDFMRTISDELYGIPSDRVIGTSSALRYDPDEAGGWIAYRGAIDYFDDGPMKPVHIWSRIGLRPIFAVGNSNGDVPMLEYCADPSRPAFGALLNHDDAAREVAYTAGAEKAVELAKGRGWSVISMKNDWNAVFA